MPRRHFSFIAVLCLLTARAGWSQDTRGAISGRVTDPSGAIIAGAQVSVTNPAMGTKSAVTTNADGIYRAPLLSPGKYQIEVTAPGFKKAVRSDVEVRVADRLAINIVLEIGASEQQVTVTSELPILTTERSEERRVGKECRSR